jgi:hypothetical protein
MHRGRRRYERPDGFAADRFANDLWANWGIRRWGLDRDAVRAALVAAPPPDYAAAVRRVFELYAAAHGKSRYGDKTPTNVMHVDLIGRLFPEAKVIHMIRDGRNGALSYLDVEFGPRSVAEAAFYWGRAVRRGRSEGRRLGPARYLEIRYEDFVEDPERTVRAVCEFVDLPFDDAMLRYFERADRLPHGPARNERAHRNLSLPPTRGMRDWTRDMSRRDVAVFETLAGDVLDEVGYARGLEDVSFLDRMDARARWLAFQLVRGVRRVRTALSLIARRSSARRGGLAPQDEAARAATESPRSAA